METPSAIATPASPRVQVRRGAARGKYQHRDVLQILDAGLVAHVGVTTPDGPLVLPMAYGHDGAYLYLHGALANHLLNEGAGQEICATVTCVDGLVVARTPFHNSMNYRSVVVRGAAQHITETPHKLAALKLITDHIAAIWDSARPPSQTDNRKTLVMALPLTESSAKVRDGDPIDEPADVEGPWWAGVVPIVTRFAEPLVAADLQGNPNPPASLAGLAGCRPEERPRLRDGPVEP
ncbi:MAG: pyridoxamine 5'-phosphate oxidase family protein [Acidimicrobiia bacterium]|nr:pyridoxamine 5'-phosphate oxidase family protein [Acidimicrobiia bacterium]MCY4457874.1 pyridoxamine 5'-phosphate oxidase family protein [Acidimicrobiaceae bacterium]